MPSCYTGTGISRCSLWLGTRGWRSQIPHRYRR